MKIEYLNKYFFLIIFLYFKFIHIRDIVAKPSHVTCYVISGRDYSAYKILAPVVPLIIINLIFTFRSFRSIEKNIFL